MLSNTGNIVVDVHGLGKRYRIGERRTSNTLRESLSEGATRVRKWVGKRLRAAPAVSSGAVDRDNVTDHIWALRDVSFNIRAGDCVGIVGRNGAGKSTLLKVLSRVTAPTTGSARLRGRVGALLEVGTGFHPELSGRDNIQLNGSLMGMSRSDIRARFDEIVAFSEIEKFLDTPVKHYSSGMYMRLAFAVAAHLEPEILIVDEVLAVGDTKFQQKCLRKMNTVAREGRTILFVSHNMAAISSLCRTGVLMENGSVTVSGPIHTVIRKYASSGDQIAGSRWLGDAGDENAHIRETWVRSYSTNQSFDTTADLEVGIRVDILKPIEGLVLGFRLYSQFESELAYVLYDDAEASSPPVMSPGSLTKRFIIPGNTLAAGNYRIDISLGIHNFKAIVLHSDVGSLVFELENLEGLGRRFPVASERGYTSLFRPNWLVF